MRVIAVIDGTTDGAEGQTRALGGFIREGLTGDVAGETLVFYDDARARERLVALAPTRDVRLVKMRAHRPDQIVDVLAEMAGDDATTLFLFAGDPPGAEMAARLACRTGGAAMTDALGAEVQGTSEAERVFCRRTVYSGHLSGRFALRARPWCVSLDGGWSDAPAAAPAEHHVLSDVARSDAAGEPWLEDVELVEPSSAGDLAGSRFLVVAGSGAASRAGVERIAAAARRMGARFGVSRPVAMNAWAPMDRLVGVSGMRAAPALCIVVGASGAPALYWGIEKAGFIVAVNTDDEAPIVAAADVAVVDDGTAVIEALADIIARERRGD